MPLFPVIPDDLSALSDEALAAALDAHLAVVTQIEAREVGADLPAVELLDALEAGVAQIELMRSEQATREAEAEAANAKLVELVGRARIAPTAEADDPDVPADEPEAPADEPEAPADEPEVETPAEPEATPAGEALPIAAAAVPERKMSRPLPRRAGAGQTPLNLETDQGLVTITAAADIPGIPAGKRLTKVEEVIHCFNERIRSFRGNYNGPEHRIPVITINQPVNEETHLRHGQADQNWRKIANVIGPEALAASGGLCAPRTPRYELEMISTDDRPVRDNLPNFTADRGGIVYNQPPALSSITTAVGKITAAQDQTGGTTATKTCQTIACPSTTTVDVDIFYHCIRFGNLGARTFPELIQNAVDLTAAAQARLAEGALLDRMTTGSTAVTGAIYGGAANTLLGQILTAAAGMRSRQRMSRNATLRLAAPDWVLDLLVVDIMRSQFQRFDMTEAGVEALLRSVGINPYFYLDTKTAGGQVFGAQGAGALLGFPTTAVTYLYPEGTHLHLDGGTLELGIVRDSTLNATNDFQIFGETFENLATVGIESLQITHSVCASGQVTAPSTGTCPVV